MSFYIYVRIAYIGSAWAHNADWKACQRRWIIRVDGARDLWMVWIYNIVINTLQYQLTLKTSSPMHLSKNQYKTIVENIYNYPSIPPDCNKTKHPRKPPPCFHCTSSFLRSFWKNINGISIGSRLGPSIFEFYISHIKNKIFNTIKKSKIYDQYVDDIFFETQSHDEINKIK